MSDLKRETRRVLAPLLESRRLLIALITFLVGVVTVLIPELESVRDELFTLLITISLVVIGGYSIKDAVDVARDSRLNSPNLCTEGAADQSMEEECNELEAQERQVGEILDV